MPTCPACNREAEKLILCLPCGEEGCEQCMVKLEGPAGTKPYFVHRVCKSVLNIINRFAWIPFLNAKFLLSKTKIKA